MLEGDAENSVEAFLAPTRRWERERKARLEAEAIAERSLRNLFEKKEQLELLRAIVLATNESSSVEDILRLSLTHICRTSEWPVGHVYMIDESEAGKRLISTRIWYGASYPSMKAFKTATEEASFEYGIGLPGRVWRAGKPTWISDVSQDDNFPRIRPAQLTGIVAAFAFPVLVKKEVVAVLEFFSHYAVEPNPFLLQLMEEIGTQLGRVVERRRAENQLIYDASHDPLTRLSNRALFLTRLTAALDLCKSNPNLTFAVLFVDLDRFKVVNDSLGHHVGDALIVEVAARLSTSVFHPNPQGSQKLFAELQTLARFGGDEFTILIEYSGDFRTITAVADQIQQALVVPFRIADHDLYISASIGIAQSTIGYSCADEMLRDADIAMYHAKARGKACYEVFDSSMYALAFSRLEMDTSLRKALRDNEFVLYYQPIVSLASSEIVGFEALLRWQKPHGEIVLPGSFISIAEDTGLIVPLGIWVLREACRTMCSWNAVRDKPLRISVNVSVRQFIQDNFVEEITKVIWETGIDPQTVILEITESVAMGDAERTINVLSELSKIGLSFSLDDFGTGYSSLSYLHRFPLRTLKIDRSFINRMNQDLESLALVKTMLAMAHGIGMEVVAEGVETAAHITELISLGCDLAQGYFFYPPLPAISASQLLKAERPSFSVLWQVKSRRQFNIADLSKQGDEILTNSSRHTNNPTDSKNLENRACREDGEIMTGTNHSEELQVLAERLRPLYQRLAEHRLYAAMERIEDLHVFMESHVFAVWDFMSLLKALQGGLTCIDVPWTPSRFPESRRLVNEIVLGEESDLYRGRTMSHFELYRLAMQECGADTSAIDNVVSAVEDGKNWESALSGSGASVASKQFVRTTFECIERGRLHEIAAAFTFGREDLIPDMFRGFVRDQDERLSGRLQTMRWYLERHIEVDGEEHGPMALKMISELCGQDVAKWEEASEAAEIALRARLMLWDGITQSLQQTISIT
jgi:diguanylate cyclase (GGDEF)-like protein